MVFHGRRGTRKYPAAGWAAGCLSARMLRHRMPEGDKLDVMAQQGVEVGRPSQLRLPAHETGRKIHVSVGGDVIDVGRRTFLRPAEIIKYLHV